MKKLIVFLVICAVSLAMSAQKSLGNAYGASLSASLDSADVENFEIFVNKAEMLYYNIAVICDSISAPSVTFLLQGKDFDHQSYTNIDSVTWTGTADTSFVFSQESTKQAYRYYNVKATVADGKCDVTTKFQFLK
jgi:hypothetical protein